MITIGIGIPRVLAMVAITWFTCSFDSWPFLKPGDTDSTGVLRASVRASAMVVALGETGVVAAAATSAGLSGGEARTGMF